MKVRVRGETDDSIEQTVRALEKYQAEHPRAAIEIYRYNPASLRIRIIDADFKGTDRADRHDLVWELFEDLPDEVVSEISLLLLLTPKEAKTSYANMEFDNPVPSML